MISTANRPLLVGILATTFFLPTLFGSISIVVALLLALIAGAIASIHSARTGKFHLQPTLVSLLVAFGILAVVFALNADDTGELNHLVSFLGLALPILLYQFLVSAQTSVSFAKIAAFCILGCLVGLLFALAQRYGLGIGRTVAVTAGSNAIGRVALILTFLSLVAVRPNMLSRKNLAIFAVFAGLAIVVLSGSRGTLLTVPLALAIAFFFAAPVVWEKSKRLFWGLIGLGGIAIAFIFVVDPSGMVSRTILTLSELLAGRMPGLSSELRMELLLGAWKAFLNSPLLGYGWASHWDALMSVNPNPEYFASVREYFTFHNDIADFAVAGGVVGLIAYALIILAPIVNLIIDAELRANRRAAYALVLLPLCFFVFGLTDFVFGFDLLTTLYGFSLAFILAAAKNEGVQ